MANILAHKTTNKFINNTANNILLKVGQPVIYVLVVQFKNIGIV